MSISGSLRAKQERLWTCNSAIGTWQHATGSFRATPRRCGRSIPARPRKRFRSAPRAPITRFNWPQRARKTESAMCPTLLVCPSTRFGTSATATAQRFGFISASALRTASLTSSRAGARATATTSSRCRPWAMCGARIICRTTPRTSANRATRWHHPKTNCASSALAATGPLFRWLTR